MKLLLTLVCVLSLQLISCSATKSPGSCHAAGKQEVSKQANCACKECPGCKDCQSNQECACKKADKQCSGPCHQNKPEAASCGAAKEKGCCKAI